MRDRETWRERAAAEIERLTAVGVAEGLEGLALRKFVRERGPHPAYPSYPLHVYRQEFARAFKGFRPPGSDGAIGRKSRAIKPAEGQGSLFE